MYFQSRSPKPRDSPSAQAQLNALEDVAADAHARSRSRASSRAPAQDGTQDVTAALRDTRFRAAFLAVLCEVSATLRRLKARHGRDFWAIHAGLVGDRRLLRRIDDLGRHLDRLLAKGVPKRAVQQQRSPPTIASPEFRYTRTLFPTPPPRARVPSDVAAPPPAYEEETPEQRAALEAEHAAAKQEEADSAFLLAEALAALDAAEEEHARSEAAHAATVQRAREAVTQRSDAENAQPVAEHVQKQQQIAEPEPESENSSEEDEGDSSEDEEAHELAPAGPEVEISARLRILPATPLDEARAATPVAEESPSTPVAGDEARTTPRRGLSRGVLATLQALEAASGVGVTTVTLRPAHARSARRVSTF
jgi:hypothetical protein